MIVLSAVVAGIVLTVVVVGFRYFSKLARKDAEKREKFKN